MPQYINRNQVRTTGRFAPSVSYNTPVRQPTQPLPDIDAGDFSFNIDLSSIGRAIQDASDNAARVELARQGLELDKERLRLSKSQTIKKEKDTALLNAYTNDINNIQLGVSQGMISEQDALVRTRAVNNKYLGMGLPANEMGTVYNYFGGGQLQRDDEQRDMLLKNQTEQDIGFANAYVKNNPAAANMPLSYQVMKGKEAAEAQTQFYNDLYAASLYNPDSAEHKMHKEAANNQAITMTDYDLSTMVGTILNDRQSTALQKKVLLTQAVRDKGIERGLSPAETEEVANRLLDTYKDTLELNDLTTIKHNNEMQTNLQQAAMLDYKNRMLMANGDNYLLYLTSSNFNQMLMEATMANKSPLLPPVQYNSADTMVQYSPNPSNVSTLKDTSYESRWANAYNNRFDTISRTYMPADLNEYMNSRQRDVYDNNIDNMSKEFGVLKDTGVAPEVMQDVEYKLQSELGMRVYANLSEQQRIEFDNAIANFNNETAKNMMLLKDGNLVVSKDVWDKNKNIFQNMYGVLDINFNNDKINEDILRINNLLRMYNRETKEQLLRAAFYERDGYILRNWTEADGDVFDGTNPTLLSTATNRIADNVNRGADLLIDAADTGLNRALTATADVSERITNNIYNSVSPDIQRRMIEISNSLDKLGVADIVEAARRGDVDNRDEAALKNLSKSSQEAWKLLETVVDNIDINIDDRQTAADNAYEIAKRRYQGNWNQHIQELGYDTEEAYREEFYKGFDNNLIGNINLLKYYLVYNEFIKQYPLPSKIKSMWDNFDLEKLKTEGKAIFNKSLEDTKQILKDISAWVNI